MTWLDAYASLAALTSGEPLARTLKQLTAAKAQLELQISDLNGKVGTVQSTSNIHTFNNLQSNQFRFAKLSTSLDPPENGRFYFGCGMDFLCFAG